LFRPYISYITQEMIFKVDNQYFLATPSPFKLNDLLENPRDELAIFMLNYEERQTIVRQPSAGELHEIYQHGVDLFSNNENYI
jgi:hypothetical protein